jgi:hypothetical protein
MKILFLESEIKMPVMKLPVRTSVIKTDSALIVISPIDFTDDQLKKIEQLGGVTDLVAPSMLHHLFMGKAFQKFPKAKVWGMPGLLKKRPDIMWSGVLGKDPWPYQSEIEMVMIEGISDMAEVAFFCKPLKTLIVADLCFNLQNPKGLGAAILTRMLGTYGRFAVSRLLARYMKDKAAFEKSVSQILQWNFEQIAMGHGDVLTSNGRKLLEQALHERGYLLTAARS